MPCTAKADLLDALAEAGANPVKSCLQVKQAKRENCKLEGKLSPNVPNLVLSTSNSCSPKPPSPSSYSSVNKLIACGNENTPSRSRHEFVDATYEMNPVLLCHTEGITRPMSRISTLEVLLSSVSRMVVLENIYPGDLQFLKVCRSILLTQALFLQQQSVFKNDLL